MAAHVEYMLEDPVGVRLAEFDEFDVAMLWAVLRSADAMPRMTRMNLDLTDDMVSSLLDELDGIVTDAHRWRSLVDNVTENLRGDGNAE